MVVDGQVGGLGFDLNARRDVTLSLREFQPHVNQAIDFMLVNQDALILSRAIVDELPSPCMNLRMQRSVPFRVRRVDFYADVNGNATIDSPPTDHSWREELGLDGSMVFAHSFDFVDLTPCPAADPNCARNPPQPGLEDFVMGLRNPGDVASLAGSPLQVVLINLSPEGGEAEVGYYRLNRVPNSGETVLTLPSVVDGGSEYRIEVAGGTAGSTRVCAIETTAPSSGRLFLELDLQPAADPPCEARPPRMMFEDCAT